MSDCKLCDEGMPIKKYLDGSLRHFDGLAAWHVCTSSKLSKQEMAARHTRLGWMEKNQLEVSQWHCSACEKIFHYANDENDYRMPNFCPECGRKNLRA